MGNDSQATVMLHVVLASRNVGKVREFARLLGPDLSVDVLPETISLPEETGTSFAENAELKAQSVFTTLGGTVAVLADDSGLEVDALEGRPGVRSARFAGEAADDSDNVARLLQELEGSGERGAQFVCELVLLAPPASTAPISGCDGMLIVKARGVLRGEIEYEPQGTQGFGYDPVFRPQGWDVTLAEAGAEDKDAVSHRGNAVRALVARLRELDILG